MAEPYKFKSIQAQLIGPPGTGKSVAAASFYPLATKERPCYVFDLNGKIDALKVAFPKAFADEVIVYDNYRVGEAEKIAQKLNEFQRTQINRRPKITIMDDLTALGDMFLDLAIRLRGGSAKGGIFLNELSDYNVEAKGLLKILNVWREPEFDDIYRFLITHEYEVRKDHIIGPKAGTTEYLKYTLVGGQKLGPKIPGYFNEVYQFFTKEPAMSNDVTRFMVRTRKVEDGDLAKSILGLPTHIDFTKDKNNLEGSLWMPIEKHLKEKGLL